jgi:hypothetical protein
MKRAIIAGAAFAATGVDASSFDAFLCPRCRIASCAEWRRPFLNRQSL